MTLGLFGIYAFGHGDVSSMLQLAAVSPVIALDNYAGKYEKKIFSTFINGMDVFSDINTRRGVKSTLKLTKLTVSDGARPYSSTEQIEGDELLYSGRDLVVKPGKRELAIEIKKYQQTFMEEMARLSDAKASVIPFAEYTWNQVILKLANEINNKTIWHGFDSSATAVWASGDTYAVGDYVRFTPSGIEHYYKATAATTAGQSPTTHPAKWQRVNSEAIAEGFGEKFKKMITDGDVTAEVIGAIDNSSVHALEAFRHLYRSTGEGVRANNNIYQYCSYTDYEYLLDDIEQTLSKSTIYDLSREAGAKRGRGIYLPGTDGRCIVKPCTWMTGTRRIVTTIKENMMVGTDKDSDMNTISTVESELWSKKYGISFLIGVEIQDTDPTVLVLNDQV